MKKATFWKTFVLPVLWLFVVPLVAFFTATHGATRDDELIISSIAQNIDRDASLEPAQKDALKALYRERVASAVCFSTDPQEKTYRENACETFGEVWQFAFVRVVAAACAVVGFLALLIIAGLSLLARSNRDRLYWSFVIGWRFLMGVSVFEVVSQSAMVVWLSYWLTALFLHVYVLKLIFVVAALAVWMAWRAIDGLFQKTGQIAELEAELVTEAAAPALWARLRRLAVGMETKPPEHVAVGIDDNFFVTEAPLKVSTAEVEGRTLYMSLPLLRLLQENEADAVVCHELAHLKGDDTKASSRLGPKLSQFDGYLFHLQQSAAFFVVPLMLLFRALFELARGLESRRREFLADQLSAAQTSAAGIVHSLIKLAAYSSYRRVTERALFENRTRYDNGVGIAKHVAAGLAPHAASAHFVDEMKDANVPHPFDSHPPLSERMANVAHSVEPAAFAQLVAEVPASTWHQLMPQADAIEGRLWSAYEARFAEAHEISLAYQYRPSSDEERAVVVKHFPVRSFELQSASGEVSVLEVSIDGIHNKETHEQMTFAEIVNIGVDRDNFSNALDLYSSTSPTMRINLKELRTSPQEFEDTIGLYWHRERRAREAASALKSEEQAPSAP